MTDEKVYARYDTIINEMKRANEALAAKHQLYLQRRQEALQDSAPARALISRLESNPTLGRIFKMADAWRTNKMTMTRLYAVASVLGYTPGEEKRKIEVGTGRTILWFGDNLHMTIWQAQRFDWCNAFGYVKSPYVDLPSLTQSQVSWLRHFQTMAQEYWEAKFILKNAEVLHQQSCGPIVDSVREVYFAICSKPRYIRRLIRRGLTNADIYRSLDPLAADAIMEYSR